MGELRTIQWEEISDMAEPLFRVWTDGREIDWAKKSWLALSKRNLTSYSDQVEQATVIVKLIALADIYREFCQQAFDETYEPEYTIWASDLDLNAFRVAQCVGPQFECDQEADDQTLLDLALTRLVGQARPIIYSALKAEFGDDSLLFVSLWSTADFEKDEDRREDGKHGADQDAEINWTEDAY